MYKGGFIRALPQAQRATALHFFTSNLFAFLLDEEATTELEDSPAGIMFTSLSRVAIDWTRENPKKSRSEEMGGRRRRESEYIYNENLIWQETEEQASDI